MAWINIQTFMEKKLYEKSMINEIPKQINQLQEQQTPWIEPIQPWIEPIQWDNLQSLQIYISKHLTTTT